MAKELDVHEKDIIDFELCLVDTQPSAIIGLHEEFVSSGRLDNMMSSLTSVDALVSYANNGVAKTGIAAIHLYDNEEVGSSTAQGAKSSMMTELNERIFYSLNRDATKEDYYVAMRNSMVVSADMAHAINPNYPQHHQTEHSPELQKGIVLKISAG